MAEVARGDGTSFTVTVTAGEDPAAPVIVVVPAMGMRARYYAPLTEALAAAGLNAAVAEQRGHDSSGRVPGRGYDYGYAELLVDLAAAVEVVRRELPQAPVVLLGHSLGGQVATMYAGVHPERLAGLVLLAATTPYWRHWGPRLLVAGYAFPSVSALVGHFPGTRLRFAGRESRGVMRDWGRLARTGRLPAGEAGLASVGVPVLAVSIEGDALGVPAAVDALAALLPRATLTREHLAVDGIDHFKWARRPEVVVPLIVSWAGGVGPTV